MAEISLYNTDVAMNAVLYVIERMGGRVDIHKLFKTLYFADREHLSKYGRSITRDRYIAMRFGPVPSNIYDILKAVRGDSYFSYAVKESFGKSIHFVNKDTVEGIVPCDTDYLSASDRECLDGAIMLCKDLDFDALTSLSHGKAWHDTQQDSEMSIDKILRENGCTEEYIEYVLEEMAFDKYLTSLK